MNELTIKIPDEKLDFFIELVKELEVEVIEKKEVPEEHKSIVRERVKRSNKNPNRLLDWDEVKQDLKTL